MQPENEISGLPPIPIPMDDTIAPTNVVKTVEALRAAGKKINVEMTQTDYAKLMAMSHEDRLAYAMTVMQGQEWKAAVKAGRDRRLAGKRKKQRSTADRKRQKRRNRSK